MSGSFDPEKMGFCRQLVSERVLPAPREQVFRALMDRECLARWWNAEPLATTIRKFDPRPGGEWVIHIRTASGRELTSYLVFEEVAPPERLVFHSLSEPIIRMEILLSDMSGQTRVTWRTAVASEAYFAKASAALTTAAEHRFDRLAQELAGQT